MAFDRRWWRFFLRVRLETWRDRIGARLRRKAICDRCEHFFDPKDERGSVHKPSKLFPNPISWCPACSLMSIGSCEAWAVTNNCNGVFTCAVAPSRAEAIARLPEYPESFVVPVRVIEEPADERSMRNWEESQKEKALGAD